MCRLESNIIIENQVCSSNSPFLRMIFLSQELSSNVNALERESGLHIVIFNELLAMMNFALLGHLKVV